MLQNNVYKMSVGRKFFTTDYTYQSSRNKLKAYQIVEYLQKIHGIHVPEDFAEQLYASHSESYPSLLRIPLSTFDTIVEACELFEDYVLDINQLVCQEILTMLRIHTCVISEKTLAKDNIPMKSKLPTSLRLRAIVLKNGSITVTAEFY